MQMHALYFSYSRRVGIQPSARMMHRASMISFREHIKKQPCQQQAVFNHPPTYHYSEKSWSSLQPLWVFKLSGSRWNGNKFYQLQTLA